MGENKTNSNTPGSSDIEKILKERERLEQVLREKYRKEVVILFTDICGYTEYIDKRGDISGRALLLKHNSIVLPIIEEYKGKVIEIIGDAVMALFPNSLDAVKGAVAIQKGLERYNLTAEAADRIHVKMGINIGDALVDEGAVFQSVTGDVANVASRIQSQAGKDQVLLSKSVYNQVRGSEDILCRLHGTVQVKGKAEPLEIYRVMWRDDEMVLEAEPKVRLYEAPEKQKEEQLPNVLHLEVTRAGDHLKISIYERIKGDENTIRHYEEVPVSIELVRTRCRELVDTLNKANRRGRVAREVLVRLREIGQVLHDELFTLNVKDRINKTRAEYMRLHLDDQLVHIPWELLNDGRQFLCQRFNMGRLIKTRQTLLGIQSRALARPLKMLILADPAGDLKGAYAEGTQIRDYMDQNRDFVNATLRSDHITADSIRGKMRNFDVVHFAGHADYNPQNPQESGWRLSDGSLKTRDIAKMAGTATMPALIFSNACQSARTDEWALPEYFQDEIFGLANAFLLAGVKHYVGTFWEILDDPSRRFALEVYKYLFSGVTVGEATRQARSALIKKYGEQTIVWASYLLYGDPTFNYMDQIKIQEPREEMESPRGVSAAADIRTRDEVIDFTDKAERKKGRSWWAIAAGIFVLAAVMLWGYPGFLTKSAAEYERKALAYFKAGDYAEAIKTCEDIQERNPRRCLGYLILGNIHLLEGDFGKAKWQYEEALKAEKGSDTEKAEALIGLGRIASIENKTDQALNLYQQAAKLAPAKGQTYVSQAMLLERQGRYDEALNLFAKAQALSPDDRSIEAVSNETQEKVALISNREKQERINGLVRELLDSFDKSVPSAPWDGWTSLPLTVWVMDFKSLGHGLQEGEERLVTSGIAGQLIEKSRVRIVERAILDELMKELKLGTSRLVDKGTALSLGKIMAARVISSGQIVHEGGQTQVAVRLIETETGEVMASVSEVFVNAVSPSVIADKLSGILLTKLKALYPLRGKIDELREEGIVLNIGQKQGVRIGQQFKVVDNDWILEVSAVQKDRSTAKVKRGYGNIKEGLRVEVLQEG